MWRDNRDGNNEIYYKEYTPAGGWDLVDTRLTINSASQIQPQVDADPLTSPVPPLPLTPPRPKPSLPQLKLTPRRAALAFRGRRAA